MDTNKITKFLFELSQSKYIKKSGYYLIRDQDPESFGEHAYRSAIITFILANMEDENPSDLACFSLFYKIYRLRLLEDHKVSTNYKKRDYEAHKKVLKEQFSLLDKNSQGILDIMFKLNDFQKMVVKDADQLAMAITAREYEVEGKKGAAVWLDRIGQAVKTDSAKELLKQIRNTDPDEWWKGLKEEVAKRKDEYVRRV